MSEREVNELFAKNLTRLMEEHGLSQEQFGNAIGVTQQAVSRWLTGQRSPRMRVIDQICEYFGVSRSALLDDGYYKNEDTAEIAQEIHDNPELRLLFSAAKDADPQTLKDIHDMLLIMERRERGENE